MLLADACFIKAGTIDVVNDQEETMIWKEWQLMRDNWIQIESSASPFERDINSNAIVKT